MLRRLALLLALLGPAAGQAQVAGTVTVVPTAFGTADCSGGANSSKSVLITWTVSINPVATDFYRILLSSTSGCPAGSAVLADNVLALGATQSYPTVGTLTRTDFLTAAGITSCTAATIYVCVELWPALGGGSGATPRATATGNVKLEVLPPPVPVGVAVEPGDSSLFVSWGEGTSTGVLANSWNVTATATTNPADTHVQAFYGTSSNRVTGLANGVTYAVSVTSVSVGGNESVASSPVVTGTPQPVAGFWEQYVAAGGKDPGGCAGGPAGAVSLLVAALALRGLRRRS
jgi:hypothetical protein